MADFNVAFALTIKNEGGYSNNTNDRGGETYKGIARKRNPKWAGWETIDALKRSKSSFPSILDSNDFLQKSVADFYETEYWSRNKLSLFNNQNIANKMFNIGVNMGTAVAAKMLQRTLNVTNQNQKWYKDLTEDGIIGGKTIAAVNTHPRPGVVYKCLNVIQGERYINLAERNQSQEAFINGWFMNRISAVIDLGRMDNMS